MWSITNTRTRQTRNVGIQRKRRLNALRSSLVSYCASDSSASVDSDLVLAICTTGSSYVAPPVHHASHSADHDMRVRSLFVLLAGSRSVPGSRSREKWQGHNTAGEAFRGWPVRPDTTHGQPRAHRGELTELRIRSRRSWMKFC